MSRLLYLLLFAALGCSVITDTDIDGLDDPPPPPPARDASTGRDSATAPDATTAPDTSTPPPRCECESFEVCVDGRCECGPGLTRAGSDCVDLATDPRNCGMVGNECASGVCLDGDCVDVCADGLDRCDGSCVDLRSDPFNCGGCGSDCGSTKVCVVGHCENFRPAEGCTSCPCDSCEGGVCCALEPTGDGAVICVDAEQCPTRVAG